MTFIRKLAVRRSLLFIPALAAIVLLAGFTLSRGVASADTALTFNETAELSQTQTMATVTGTIQCTAGDTTDVNVMLLQPSGRQLQIGQGFIEVTCDGTVQDWMVNVTDIVTAFKPGPASIVVQTGPLGIGLGTTVSGTVKLQN